jgi:hypothetical protein
MAASVILAKKHLEKTFRNESLVASEDNLQAQDRLGQSLAVC